jgi:hypothetical protein
MPNATVRANARPMPKPKPGSVASIRRQTAELETATALLKGAQVVERGTAKQDAELDAKHNLFGRAYARWLRARAVMDDPDADCSEQAWAARFKALDDAERTLLVTPPLSDEMLWQKWEVLESFVSCDAIAGQATDNRAIMALGCIKADLLRLGIGRPA